MPNYIVKPDPNVDFYVLWNTVVDCPTYSGTRAELSKVRSFVTAECWADERFARADDNGTSANWPDWPKERLPFAWSDESFMVRECLPYRSGFYSVLHRRNLRAFVDAMNADDMAQMESLVEWRSDNEG